MPGRSFRVECAMMASIGLTPANQQARRGGGLRPVEVGTNESAAAREGHESSRIAGCADRYGSYSVGRYIMAKGVFSGRDLAWQVERKVIIIIVIVVVVVVIVVVVVVVK